MSSGILENVERKNEENTRDQRIFNGGRIVKFRCDSASSMQSKVMLSRGWVQVTEPADRGWDLWWCERSEVRKALSTKLESRQKIPHYENHHELTRKDYLWRNLKRFCKLLKKAGKFREAELADSMPITFELPGEYRMLVEEYHKQGGGTWIVKPAAGSQGRGIFLFRRLKDLADWKTRESHANSANEGNTDSFVVQKYLEDPYLVAVWLAREGFARLSGVAFSLDKIDDSRVHLTNMSIQLKAEGAQRSRRDQAKVTPEAGSSSGDICDAKRGRKWSLIRLREFLTARHGSPKVETLFQRVAGIVMASLQSVQSVMIHSSNSFELYGYDIIIEANLRPWLLEINASPALTPTDDVDHRLKYDMLQDALNVLDLEGVLTGREHRVGGFDLLWDTGPVWTSCSNGFNTAEDSSANVPRALRKLNIFLGTRNDREDQLKKMHEGIETRRKISRPGTNLA